MVKTPLGLGLTLDPNNRVTAAMPDSQAARSGTIRLGDQVISLHGKVGMVGTWARWVSCRVAGLQIVLVAPWVILSRLQTLIPWDSGWIFGRGQFFYIELGIYE